MAFYSGSNGELIIDGKKAARVANWSFNSNLALLDTTSLADTDRTVIPGVRSTTGSCTLFYYADDGSNENSASVLINKLIKVRNSAATPGQAAESQSVTLKLRVDDGSTTGRYLTGVAYLTSVQMAMAVGEVLSATCSFEFNGAPTEVLL